MTTFEQFQINYKYGAKILSQLFELKSKDIIDKIKSIVSWSLPSDNIFEYNPSVQKISRNDEPVSITISFYDSIEITENGIHFKPEHGNTRMLIEFNEHFKL